MAIDSMLKDGMDTTTQRVLAGNVDDDDVGEESIGTGKGRGKAAKTRAAVAAGPSAATRARADPLRRKGLLQQPRPMLHPRLHSLSGNRRQGL